MRYLAILLVLFNARAYAQDPTARLHYNMRVAGEYGLYSRADSLTLKNTAQQLAQKADATAVYTQTQVNALLQNAYIATPVTTKAEANAAATGLQKRIITVAIDESDSNRAGNVYLYHGNNQPLGYPLF